LMQQHFGKFEKLFCSIALILHLAEGSIGSKCKAEGMSMKTTLCDLTIFMVE